MTPSNGCAPLFDDARQLPIDPERDEGDDRAGKQIGAPGTKTELAGHDEGPERGEACAEQPGEIRGERRAGVTVARIEAR